MTVFFNKENEENLFADTNILRDYHAKRDQFMVREDFGVVSIRIGTYEGCATHFCTPDEIKKLITALKKAIKRK